MSKFVNINEKKIISLHNPIFLSMETMSNILSMENIDEKDKVCYPILLELDEISRNNSLYDGQDTIKSLEESIYVQEQIRSGCWFGELTHPPADCSQERFMTVDHNNVNHRIFYYKVNGNIVSGKVQFVPPKGNITWEWIRTGSNLAFSIRILTPTYVKKKTESGQTYIYKYGKMIPITFDAVYVPGFKKARMVPLEKYDASAESFKNNPAVEKFKKSMEGLLSTEDWNRIVNSGKNIQREETINQSDLKKLMASQESMHIIEDLFQFSLESADVILKENSASIKINSTEAVEIPLSTFLVNTILSSKNKQIKK